MFCLFSHLASLKLFMIEVAKSLVNMEHTLPESSRKVTCFFSDHHFHVLRCHFSVSSFDILAKQGSSDEP